MLGISVYFQDFSEQYLNDASLAKVRYVFTSLHIPEEDYSTLPDKLPIFLDTCKELGLEIVPDISPQTLEKLNIQDNNFNQLKQMGFKAVRLDYGLDDIEVVKELMEDFDLFLNASVVDEKYLQQLQEAKIPLEKITLTHNFYPHPETGLSLEDFKEKNKLFKQYGFKIQAFVCGDKIKRYPLYEGLPTVEAHRDIHPLVAAVELLETQDVDDIFIGDSEAKIDTLKQIQFYMQEKVIVIKAHFEKEFHYLYDEIQTCRKDNSKDVIRLNTPRIQDVPQFNNGKRYRGTITMDNSLFGRYAGEIQLIKKEKHRDARVNIIGFIHPDYIELVDFIKPESKIKFEKL